MAEAVSKLKGVEPKPGKEEDEIGYAEPLTGAGWWLEFPMGVNTKKGQLVAPNNSLVSIDDLIEMRRKDGQARALLRLFQLPILNALKAGEWTRPDDMEETAESDTAKTPEEAGDKAPSAEEGTVAEDVGQTDEADEPLPGQDEVDFANAMWNLPPNLGGMTVSRSKMVRQVLLGLMEGFSAFETVYWIPDEGPLKGKWALKKLAHRDARTIKFLIDDKGGFDGLRQIASVRGSSGPQATDVTMPADKSWYWACNEEENPFYGVSMFESAWFHWDVKRKLYYMAHIAAQMSAVKARVGYIPPNASPNEVASFKTALADLAFNGAMTAKGGSELTTFKVDTLDSNTGFPFLDMINHQNLQMAMSVLAKFLNEENRQVLIENGDTDASTDYFVMALEAIMEEIAESWTRYLMPKFIDWNFDSGIYPVYHFGPLSDSTKDIVKEMLIAVATAQSSQLTPEFIREAEKQMADRLGLDIDYDEIDKREAVEREAAQKQKDLEQKQLENYFAGGPQQPPAGPPTQPGAEAGAAVQSGGV